MSSDATYYEFDIAGARGPEQQQRKRVKGLITMSEMSPEEAALVADRLHACAKDIYATLSGQTPDKD